MKLFAVDIDGYGVLIFEAANHKSAQDHVEDLIPTINVSDDQVTELLTVTDYKFEHNNFVEVTPFNISSKRALMLNTRDSLQRALNNISKDLENL